MSRTKRIIAAFFAVLMLGEAILPTAAYALSSGPSQPEVQGFQPAGVNDMVNLFTGDFSYNIPLLDVEGYPVNLFYNAGIGMDQEASWVGLGWNLNPGVVERNLRGLPDDFNGDLVTREMGLRPNRTVGLNLGVGLEVFGIGTSLNAAPSFNNYNGPAFSTDVSLSLRSTEANKPGMTCGIGLSSSSDRGLTVSPSIGFDVSMNQAEFRHKAGLNFGLSLNSTQGLTDASFGATLTTKKGEITKSSKSIGHSFNLGSPTYTPQVTLPMENISISLRATAGVDFFGVNPHLSSGAFFSMQQLRTNTVSRPAYGYLNLQSGANKPSAMLDFNREKDGPYSADRAALGIAALTEDVFSVSGQGVSGSYRAFRSEVGHVFDPYNVSSGADGSAGVELAAGAGAHFGMDVKVNLSSSTSGDWVSGNQAGQRLRFRSQANEPVLEPVFFREASEATVEQDSTVWNAMQRDRAVRFTLPSSGGYDHNLGSWLTQGGSTSTSIPTTNYRQKREPRAQNFSYLTHKEAIDLGLDLPPTHPGLVVPDHHISEVTIAGKDGGRYVYGVPVYNREHHEVEFSVGAFSAGSDGLVNYSPQENSVSNNKGKDHFYSKSSTPPYAYAFLLSAVLSPDYSDIDGVRGPSPGDLGNYTKFTYQAAHDNFPWRTPATGTSQNKALFCPGLLGTSDDNKATYVYGTKEVKYLDVIETRNYRAQFHTSPRLDGKGVQENGTTANAQLERLDSISLYVKNPGGQIHLLKRVHFQYGYTLCTGTPNSSGGGKLTLKRVWFTYGSSQRGVTTPYLFTYGQTPAYDRTAQDRWGNYKPNTGIGNDQFPYSEQGFVEVNGEQVPMADEYARSWNLEQIQTPSGSVITAEYEADDYAYVQDKAAMRMIVLNGITGCDNQSPNYISSLGLRGQNRLSFPLPQECHAMTLAQARDALFGTAQPGKPLIKYLYFRSKVRLATNANDYVSGYAQVDPASFTISGTTASVDLIPIAIDEGANVQVNPIFRAALEYMRLNYPKLTHPGGPEMNSEDNDVIAMFNAMVTSLSGFLTQVGNFFQGPNNELAGRAGVCTTAYPELSWIRLYEPDGIKKGGGYRVKRLKIKDNWNEMGGESEKAFTYGQEFSYGDAQGSYGVAAYEPMVGADENPWRQPVYGSKPANPLTPDERFYQETPFGESFFPSPVVGYSKVIVRDIYPGPTAQASQGTGTVVHEFYTAKDFPTRVDRTGIESPPGNNNPNLWSLLGFRKIDHKHATQGFVVETNDMHGKPRSVKVLPEGSNEAVSETIYNYARRADDPRRLSNAATVIDPQGNIGRAEIGRQYEFLADTREFMSVSGSMGMNLNTEMLPVPFLPLPIPIILPSVSTNSVAFRSGVLVKKVHRFGLLTGVTQIDNGSSVTTENLAYDALTGSVLLTRLTNAFEDPIYSFNFPAYWHYEGMGPAFRNIGVHTTLALNAAGVATVPNAKQLFFPGDVLSLATNTGFNKAWVNAVGDNTVELVDQVGDPVTGTWPVKVIRSGRRNMQAVNMMTLTLQSDPLVGMGGNLYANLLDAKAYEFKGTWRAECGCLDPGKPVPNDWLLNRTGLWRPWKVRVWLTDRTRTHYDNNANIRRDGIYTTFSPFYQVLNGQWAKDQAGWTTAREVTDYNGRGQELENKDALGLFSSALFGYGGTMATAIAKNARHAEIMTANFEDGVPGSDCASPWKYTGSSTIQPGIAHTGRNALKVITGNQAAVTADLIACPSTDCQLRLEAAFAGAGIGHILVEASGGQPPYGFTIETPGGGGSAIQYHQVDFNTVELLWISSDPVSLPALLRVVDGEGCRTELNWFEP